MKRIKTFLGFISEHILENPNLPAEQPFQDYDRAEELAKKRHLDFYTSLRNLSLGQIITDIKSEESFLDKTEERGKNPRKVYDVLRGAVLVKNKEEIPKVIEELKKIFIVRKIDYKTKPEGPFGYFGAVHLDVLVDGLICEIQIMTKKLWDYKKETDEYYHKYRSEDLIPKEEMEKCRSLFREANS